MTKFLYQWKDWGLFDVVEVEVVMDEYYSYNKSTSALSLVKVKNAPGCAVAFPCEKKYLFDTYDEAYAFGVKDCSGGTFSL